MKTLTVKLKQHTPLIHFQHDQYRATLRASEVKPKLDKFLIKEVFKDKWDDCKEFLIGYKKSQKENDEDRKKDEKKLNQVLKQKFDNGFRALNYKMRIEVSKKEADSSSIGSGKIPMYFGDMGDNEKKKTVHMDKINLILWIDGDLEDKLKSVIAKFFLVTNFGARQSKGYGSFYIDKEDELYKEPDGYIGTTTYIQTKFSRECKKWNEAQMLVDIFYKTIRSGINECRKICSSKSISKCKVSKLGNVNIIDDYKQSSLCKNKGCEHYIANGSVFYFKSALFHYVKCKLKKQWDKKTIKDALYNNKRDGKNELYRDLLGLANNTKFGSDIIKKQSDEDIQRYKSPIFIKPIEDENVFTFYIGFENNDELEKIKNKEFTITRNDKILLKLKTSGEFSISDYFDYLFKSSPKCNFMVDDMIGNKCITNKKTNEKVYPDSKNHEYYGLLKDIYGQLRNNYKKI